MATQPNGKSDNPGSELSKPVDVNSQDVNEQPPAVDSEKPFFTSTEPLREDQVQNAVKFLSHPRVRSSPVIHRRSFLEKKGLTKEEIDEAFRRVPDPPSNSGTLDAPNVNQAIQPKSMPAVQPQTPAQAPQPAAAVTSGVSTAPSVQQPRFQWSHAFIAAGVLTASGAGTAVFFKTVVVPRLKTWIRKVVAEENETQKEDKSGSVLAEQTAEAAKAAASAAAVVAKASQELLSSKTEERKFFEAFMGMMDVQVKEMKSMGDTIRKLESTREKTYSQDNLREQNIPFSTANGTTNNSWRTPQFSQPDATPSSVVPKQVKVNGALNPDSGEVRPSSAPATVESMIAPHSKSYMEILSMIQRGERPPNIKDINDMPPNPNQQLTQPLLAPRPKPWEVAAQQSAGVGHHSQSSGEGMSSKAEENGVSSHENGNSHNASEPWWTKKPVIEHEDVGEPRNLPSYTNRVSEQPVQRGWVPPQPPSVAIPEAAAAIRQPKSSGVKHQFGSDRSATPSEDGEGGSWRASDAVEAEPESSGSLGATEPKQTEIEEVAVDGVEVN